MVVSRFEVYYVQLNPTLGSEIRKNRPCVIVSPDEMAALNTVIVAPMTSKGFSAPSRVPLTFQGKNGLVVLDQVRTVDKSRLGKKLGKINVLSAQKICNVLTEMFTYA